MAEEHFKGTTATEILAWDRGWRAATSQLADSARQLAEVTQELDHARHQCADMALGRDEAEQQAEQAEQQSAAIRAALEGVLGYAFVGIARGPAIRDWSERIDAAKRALLTAPPQEPT